ncbi:MAG: histidinol-phosphate transaminase [Burkholderiales bacterium]
MAKPDGKTLPAVRRDKPTPEHLIRPDILALQAYRVAAADGLVKLDAMENPYALPEALCKEIGERLAKVPFNRYPDPHALALKALLRDVLAIPDGLELLLGNGSDELIQLVALALARPDAVLLGFEPSFAMYPIIAASTGMHYVGVALEADFSVNIERTLAAVERHAPALIFIAYPNNPSGNLFDEKTLLRIVDAAPGLVVIDEAYHAFALASFMPGLARHPNVLVMRTLSKLGLAGLRLGLLIGSSAWFAQLDKLRLPYNINVLTQTAAVVTLRHFGVLQSQAQSILAEREQLQQSLSAMADVKVFPSRANFVLFKVAHPGRVFDGLKKRRVLIKNLHGSHPLLRGCLRVTVGTPDENAQFVQALGETLHWATPQRAYRKGG